MRNKQYKKKVIKRRGRDSESQLDRRQIGQRNWKERLNEKRKKKNVKRKGRQKERGRETEKRKYIIHRERERERMIVKERN